MATNDVTLWQVDARGIRVKRTVAAAANEAIIFDGSNLPDTGAAGGGLSGYTDVASATTPDIGAEASSTLRITGTTTITGFASSTAGVIKFIVFAGALTLTHHATSHILPSGANIITAAGDTGCVLSLGSGNWKWLDFQKANGNAVVSSYVISGGAIF